MADVVILEPGKQAQYLRSVNTPDYTGNANALIDPDLSAVQAVPIKYWKRSGSSVVEMTQAEKDAVTTSELAARKESANSFNVALDDVMTALIKVVNLRLPAGQKITRAEMVNAVKEEID